MFKIRNKIVIKFVQIMPKYRIIFKDIFTFVGLVYRDVLLKTFIVLGISILNIRKSYKGDS